MCKITINGSGGIFWRKNERKRKNAGRSAIDAEEIIAIGDSYNDITMIQAAGLGVAMGNAVETVKEIANYITEDNEHDGVAAVVEKFIWEQAFALIA